MEPKARYILVGSAVLVLAALIITSVIWLSRYKNEGLVSPYTIYFKKFSLSGLQIDSNVTMRGIKVGSVKDLSFSSKDIELVKVTIRVDNDTPVKTDTRAVINRNLLTGLASIDLIGSSQGALFLVEAPQGEDYPVIPEGESSLEKIQSTLPETIDKINYLLERGGAFFSPENEQAVSAILLDLRTITARVASGEDRLARTAEEVIKLAAQLRQVAENFNQRGDDVARSIQATADVVSRELARLTSELGTAARSLAATAQRFEDPKTLLLGPDRGELGPAEEGVK